MEKTCTQCHALKPINAFPQDKKRVDGHRALCKLCSITNVTAWRTANAQTLPREKTCPICQVTQPLDDFHRSAKAKDGHHGWCKACVRVSNLKNRTENLAREQARAATYRVTHKAEIRAAAAAKYIANSEEILARNRAWREENPELNRAMLYAWRTTHPEKQAEYARRRRADRINAPFNDLSAEQWNELLDVFGHRCAYCHRKMKRLTQDHVTPYTKNGSHTLWNIVPACLSCNSKKGNRGILAPVQPLLLTIAPSTKKKE